MSQVGCAGACWVGWCSCSGGIVAGGRMGLLGTASSNAEVSTWTSRRGWRRNSTLGFSVGCQLAADDRSVRCCTSLLGFAMYASIYSRPSARRVDQESDAQYLMLPAMLPLLAARTSSRPWPLKTLKARVGYYWSSLHVPLHRPHSDADSRAAGGGVVGINRVLPGCSAHGVCIRAPVRSDLSNRNFNARKENHLQGVGTLDAA